MYTIYIDILALHKYINAFIYIYIKIIYIDYIYIHVLTFIKLRYSPLALLNLDSRRRVGRSPMKSWNVAFGEGGMCFKGI